MSLYYPVSSFYSVPHAYYYNSELARNNLYRYLLDEEPLLYPVTPYYATVPSHYPSYYYYYGARPYVVPYWRSNGTA